MIRSIGLKIFLLLLAFFQADAFMEILLSSKACPGLDRHTSTIIYRRHCAYGKYALLMSSSSSRKTQMQEYTIVPIIGKYTPSSDVKTDAIYLSKPNMRVVDIKDKEEPGKMGDQKDIYQRRIAKQVIPVPLTRGSSNGVFLYG